MNIEVTKETFYRIIDDKDNQLENVESNELASKAYYWNDKIDQRAMRLINYNGNIVQYYLIDINA